MKFPSFLVAAAVVLIAVQGSSAGDGRSSPDPVERGVSHEPSGQAFRTGIDLVALVVSVRDGSERYVAGLDRESFEVYEDGVRQEIAFFSDSGLSLDLILLVDVSASMREKLPAVKRAARGFIATLRPGDRGAIITFNHRMSIAQDLVDDPAGLEAALDGFRATGGTSLYSTIYVTLHELAGRLRAETEVRRQAVVLLSDGDDTTSPFGFDRALEMARRTGVNIYTISLEPDHLAQEEPRPLRHSGRYSETDHELRMLARETGGEAFFPRRVNDLATVYGAIAEELAHQYALGYMSSNLQQDGSFRRITVRVVGRADVWARARTGYYADGGRPSLAVGAGD